MAAERIARELFDQAGFSVIGKAGPGRLAIKLLHGEHAIDFAEQTCPVVLLRDPWRLLLRADLSDEQLSLCVAAGLAEWWLAQHPDDRRVTTRSRLAAAIALPELALREAVDRLDGDVEAIAYEFVVPVDFVHSRLRTVKPGRGSGLRYKFGVAS